MTIDGVDCLSGEREGVVSTHPPSREKSATGEFQETRTFIGKDHGLAIGIAHLLRLSNVGEMQVDARHLG